MAAITMRQLLIGARERLGNPDQGRLPNSRLLFRAWSLLDYYRGQLNISAQDWLIGQWPLLVTPNTSEFTVTATDQSGITVGRWVECWTVDTTGDPTFCAESVPIVTVQDITPTMWQGSKVVTGTPSRPHVAVCFTPYAFNGVPTMRVTPQHGLSANYLFFYEPDHPTPPNINDTYPLSADFANLVECHLAISVSPCLIEKDPQTKQVANKDEIELILAPVKSDMQMMTTLFQTYKNQQIQDKAGSRLGFAHDEPLFDAYVF